MNLKSLSELYDSVTKCKKCVGFQNQLRRPWIGKEYSKPAGVRKILFIGINMNRPEPEDTDLMEFIDKHPEFHTKGLYGFMPSVARQALKLKEDNPRKIYDYFSFTNIVKCSPQNTQNGNPTEEMWEKCDYIKNEIEFIEPDLIIAVGCYDQLIKRFDLQNGEPISEELRRNIVRIKLKDNNALVIKVDHPSMPRTMNTVSNRLSLLLGLLKDDFRDSELYKALVSINSNLGEEIAVRLIKEALRH